MSEQEQCPFCGAFGDVSSIMCSACGKAKRPPELRAEDIKQIRDRLAARTTCDECGEPERKWYTTDGKTICDECARESPRVEDIWFRP